MSSAESKTEYYLRLNKYADFEINEYRDEPIITSASEIKNPTPSEILSLRRDSTNIHKYDYSNSRRFYVQAKNMASFEDCYDYSGTFFKYYATYADMSIPQLRGYFSWRTRVRRGEIEKTSLSFAFVYLYELIHMIGFDSPVDCFEHFKDFSYRYSLLDSSVKQYASLWLADFAVYHSLDKSLFLSVADVSHDELLHTLDDYSNISDDEIFDAVSRLSAYNIEKSRFYKSYPERMKKALTAVYRRLSDYYKKHRSRTYFDSVFGRRCVCTYPLFPGAVFYNYKPRNNYEYKISENRRYCCVNSLWSLSAYMYSGKSKRLGELARCVDAVLRQRFDFPHKLKSGEAAKYTLKIINDVIDEMLIMERRLEERNVSIDLSALDGIRKSSEKTMKKIITSEEMLPDEETVAVSVTEKEPDCGALDFPCALNAAELEVLKALLSGGNADAAARENGVMLSIAVDSINEALYDYFSDNCVDASLDPPEIFEDYINELEQLFNFNQP